MSHQVLARKWRPGTFSEMVGQQHVLQALVNALESGRLHHAYLFTGTRGVGKTTVARILAKCLNCDTGVTATPCGECGACAEIAEGRSVDLIEVDAASKTGVDDMRDLLENVQYTPTRARYKIYLIDEVHMLSKNSFAALLKTLEEPPPHAMFLFATTDPQNLPATVLSRCLQFNLKNMQPEQIVSHLEQVLTAESVPSDPEALALIARAAEGSMRDALSLADQAIAYGKGKLTGAQVAEMLGTVDRGKVLDLIAALLDDNAAEVLSLVAHIAEHAPDYVSTLDELSNALHHMTIAQTVPDAMDTSWPDQARIVELAARATLDDTQLFWQMAVSGRREVHLASSARAGLEMILLRMIAFRPAAIIHLPTESGDPPAKKSEPPATPVDSEAPQPSEPAPNPREDTIAAQAAEPEASEADESGMVDADALTPERWPEGFEMFHFTGILHNIALNLALIDSRGGALQFVIKEKHATLLNERHPAHLSQALGQQLGQSVTATITVSDHDGRTPAQYRAALAAARLAEAEQAISSDQALNGLIAAFDGHIIPGSIRPNLADVEAVPLQHDAD